MNAEELITTLQKADKKKPVRILDKPASFEAEIATVEEDDEQVFIIIENWPSL
jgi:hypothetical protein